MPAHKKPTEVHRRNGNPGGRPLPEPVVVLPATSEPPKPPESLQSAGVAVWERLWRYAAAWLSPTTDLEVIVRYCQALDEREIYKTTLEKDGYFTEGSKGQTILHPAVKALRELDTQLLRLESVLGLTPADRSKLGLAEVKTASKIEQLLASKKNRRNEDAIESF